MHITDEMQKELATMEKLELIVSTFIEKKTIYSDNYHLTSEAFQAVYTRLSMDNFLIPLGTFYFVILNANFTS